jgi:hypothetical protein
MSQRALEGFDYGIECGDFLLYELGRLIDEDRASLEDDEFRRVIEAGIHEHIERRLDIRAALVHRLRTAGPADRTVHSLEDIESLLIDIPQIIQSYTAYLFERLEACASESPDERITTAADTLLDEPEDRRSAEPAIDLLGSIRSSVSARILAHVISEPMLAEDLEGKAFQYLRALWPLPRHYILYSLKPHTHEDIPFRWFQLLIECGEPSGVDRILEEVLVHAGDADYREDLLALISLLEQARDPDAEEKVVQVLNSKNVDRTALRLLEDFLKNRRPSPAAQSDDSPWAALERVYAANRRYLAAARLFDAGKKAEAARELEELLAEAPEYPFALMLRRML